MRNIKVIAVAIVILLSFTFAAYAIYNVGVDQNRQYETSVEAGDEAGDEENDEENKINNVPVGLAGMIAVLGFIFSRRRK
jgi:hypothetical protein